MTNDLALLFAPRSVAIVGASEHRDRLSGRPVRYLIDGGYAGRILPVNPKRDQVQGLPAWPSIAALPDTPDVALVVVPPQAALEAVQACAERGVRGIYLLAGGFSESGAEGLRLEQEILRIARAGGIRLIGPNCLGAFNAELRFFGTFATSLERGLPASGPVAVVSQSGAYGQHLAYLLARRGVGAKYLVTTGNELDVEIAECIAWLAGQPEVRVIPAYAEGFRDGPRLRAALEAARGARKPVVFLKVGASQAGARAAASHTAALAGRDAVHEAVFRAGGVLRARSTDDQVDLVCACVHAPPAAGGRLGIVSVSGGFGVQAADAAEAAGLAVAPLAEAAQARLRALLPMGAFANPIDVTGQAVNDLSLFGRALEIVCAAPDFDAVVVCLTTTPLAAALQAPLAEAIAQATAAHRRARPIALVMVADPAMVRDCEGEGLLVFEDGVRAVRALAALAELGRAFERPPVPATEPAPARRAATAGPGPLSEWQAKALLRDAGIPTLHESLVRTADEAAAAAASVGGAVAMKIVSARILHKTEIGGVLLDVRGEEAVRDGFRTLMARAARVAPPTADDAVLVAPMAPAGVEVILGVLHDAVFGPVVMVGGGGVLAECFQDTALRVAPVDDAEARRMIGETRVAMLLAGWRGAPPCDIDALAAALVALSRFAVDADGWLESVDINPFRVLPRGEGGVALDAVVIARSGPADTAAGEPT